MARTWTILVTLVALASCGRRSPPPVVEASAPAPTVPAPPPSPEMPPEAAPAPTVAGAADAAPPEQAPEPRDVEMVTIKLIVTPPKLAHVYWGVKDLGVAPLELRRPRGSGPMDLMLRAPGFLTHHTRVFTDRDDTLSIRLTPENEASSTFGYQAPPEKSAPAGKAKAGTKPPR
jgi:hypothetical protein